MTEDEKYVREIWKTVASSDVKCADGQHRSVCIIRCDSFPPNKCFTPDLDWETFDNLWTRAAEFTRNRLQQIRDVEEEIEWLIEQRCHPSDISTPQRILAREQAALADLKRGLRVAE